jgi:hypothetical protein
MTTAEAEANRLGGYSPAHSYDVIHRASRWFWTNHLHTEAYIRLRVDFRLAEQPHRTLSMSASICYPTAAFASTFLLRLSTWALQEHPMSRLLAEPQRLFSAASIAHAQKCVPIALDAIDGAVVAAKYHKIISAYQDVRVSGQ